MSSEQSCVGPGGLVSLCGPGSARMVFCSQDYISLIANSLYLYLATLTQLYLFLCYKMSEERYKPVHHSIIKVSILSQLD